MINIYRFALHVLGWKLGTIVAILGVVMSYMATSSPMGFIGALLVYFVGIPVTAYKMSQSGDG
jgi:multisubunit Na+/H+ antiporter MnhG subunit